MKISEKYAPYLIKEFTHWKLLLHEAQFPYLGRCYAWNEREGAKKVTDILPEEGNELFGIVIPAWDIAIRTLFQHDWPNVAILGNDTPQLHAHFIPRYQTPRIHAGIEFIDPNPKGNYSPYPKKKLEVEVLLEIKDKIKERI